MSVSGFGFGGWDLGFKVLWRGLTVDTVHNLSVLKVLHKGIPLLTLITGMRFCESGLWGFRLAFRAWG